jgi:peptidoglycan/LPS O-acetylase OafA/YrhL
MDNKNYTFNSKNNFNLIRICLSLCVVFFHCFELSQQASLKFITYFLNGEKAVQAFFIISGYLIIKSYLRSNSPGDFFTKRIKRIYPAYFTTIIICAFSGCIISTLSIVQYFSSAELYKYILSNLFFLNFITPALPGVFTENIYNTINGSLWTLKIEVGFYLLVPLIIFLKDKVNKHLLYGLLFLLSTGYFLLMKYLYTTNNNDTYLFLSRQIPGQLFYFILGVWMAELEKNQHFINIVKWAGVFCIILLFLPLPVMVQSILLAVSVYFLAYSIPVINYPHRKEDISYGLYIYHFPVIQALIFYQFYNSNPFVGLALSLSITFLLAILSWVIVEKPFILKKQRSGVNFLSKKINALQ